MFAQQYSHFNKENEFGKTTTSVCEKTPSEKYQVKKDIVTNDAKGFQIDHVQKSTTEDTGTSAAAAENAATNDGRLL